MLLDISIIFPRGYSRTARLAQQQKIYTDANKHKQREFIAYQGGFPPYIHWSKRDIVQPKHVEALTQIYESFYCLLFGQKFQLLNLQLLMKKDIDIL